jgi:hypothetical protein
MKAKNPNHYFGSPHMTQAEVNEFLEEMMRQKFGPQAEQIIMGSRILREFMEIKSSKQAQPTGSKQ